MKKNYSPQGLLLVFLAQIMVAINIVTSKSLILSIPILTLLTIRFTLAALLLLPMHWLSPANQYSFRHYFSQLNKKDVLFIIAQSLTAGVLFNLLMLFGLHYTDANDAGVITSILPVVIALMSWLLLGERIPLNKIFCIGLVSLGLCIIAYSQFKDNETHSFLGDVIILLSLLPEALYYIFSKLYSVRLPVFLLSALLNGINALLLLCFIPLYTATSLIWPGEILFLLLILGLSSGLFYVFWYFGSKNVEGMVASLSTALMPIATVLLAWLFLGEEFTLMQLLGMGIVISSIVRYIKT
jgi:drug/metabolite transporter (DMT)-like permease